MNQSNPTQTVQESNSRKITPILTLDEADLPSTKSATQETIERMEYESEAGSLKLNARGEELNEEGISINEEDSSFKSELEFDGYKAIEEYDNDSYLQNVDRKPNTTQELNFRDRAELSTGEESPVDPQENRASGAV